MPASAPSAAASSPACKLRQRCRILRHHRRRGRRRRSRRCAVRPLHHHPPGCSRAASSAASSVAALVNPCNDIFAPFSARPARRNHHGQTRVTGPHPLVIDAIASPFGVDAVQIDGLLLEGKGLLLEQHVVLFRLIRIQIPRPLRGQQVAAQLVVEIRRLEGGRRGDLCNAIVGGLRHRPAAPAPCASSSA